MGGFIDLAGQAFDRLRVIRRVENRGPDIMWTWWERLLCIKADAPLTRDQAMEKIKTPRSRYGRSEHDRIWTDYHGDYARLSALADACALGLDAVDVSVDDVALFKAHYRPDGEVCR